MNICHQFHLHSTWLGHGAADKSPPTSLPISLDVACGSRFIDGRAVDGPPWKENYSYGTENGENECTTIKYQRKEPDPVSTIISHNSGHH